MRTRLTALALLAALTLNAAGNKLHYGRPAQFFEETLLIGNGNLGAIIYGGSDNEHLPINDITLWTGEPNSATAPENARENLSKIRRAIAWGDYKAADSLNRYLQGNYSENYQPLGTVDIRFHDIDTSAVTAYCRELSLDSAISTVSFLHSGSKISRSYFASAPDSVLVMYIKSDKAFDAAVALSSPLPSTTEAKNNELMMSGYAAFHSYPSYYKGVTDKFNYDPERGTRFCSIVKVIPVSGVVTPDKDGALVLRGCKEAMILITNATSFNGFDRNPATEGRDYKALARKRIDHAASKSYSELCDTHIADYKRLYDKVSLNLGTTPDSIASLPTDVQLKRYTDLKENNPELEELYFNFGRYLLISSSRTHAVPANLQGLWNEKLLPPWSSNYTTNINVEENYWPAEVCGLGELHSTALIPWIGNLSKTGSATAANYYGVNRGWCLGHNSDLWAMTNPVGLKSGNPSWANWNMGGAWLASHIWEHYLFNRDTEWLRENYPVLRGAALFCIDWLVERDGQLITTPSTSPENIYITPQGYHGATSEGGFADIAMIRQCLLDTRAAAQTLDTDKDIVSEIGSVLAKLPPYRIGHKGNLQEWREDWDDADPTHRHQSHLYGLYPGRHITPAATPELASACGRTLEIKGDNTTGWSTGWRINLLARLTDSDKAYAMYRRLLQYVSPDNYRGPDKRSGGGTYPNLLDAHSPFQIDGNFGGTAGVAEMLIQSTPESISLLPSLPAQWRDGSVEGLRTRSGHIVDMVWKDGKIHQARIHSLAGVPVRVNYNGKNMNINLKAGQTFILK